MTPWVRGQVGSEQPPQEWPCCAKRRARQALPGQSIVNPCQSLTATPARSLDKLCTLRGVGLTEGGVRTTWQHIFSRQHSGNMRRGPKNTTSGRPQTLCVRPCGTCAR